MLLNFFILKYFIYAKKYTIYVSHIEIEGGKKDTHVPTIKPKKQNQYF